MAQLTVPDLSIVHYSGINSIDALLDSGLNWNYLTPGTNTLYYTFDISAGTESGTPFLTAFNQAQKDAATAILNYAASITGIQFVYTASGNSADIHFASNNIAGSGAAGLCDSHYGYSYISNTQVVTAYSGDAYIYLDNVEFASNNTTPTAGTSGYEVLLHEVGHALGLKHPFEGTYTLPAAQDNTNNTVMSYTWSGDNKTTFQTYDIQALQWIYGGDGIGGVQYQMNFPPTASNGSVSVNEDQVYTFGAGDFKFVDANASDTLQAVQVTSLPGVGLLALNGVAVTLNQSITIANINAGNLKFTPSSNGNGVGYASFQFKVSDGQVYSNSAYTLSVNVSPVNDAPAGADHSVVQFTANPYTFTSADFGFSDSADTPANTFKAIKIASLPTSGTLALNGIAVTLGSFVQVSDIGLGKLKFTPATLADGSSKASFTFQVQDDGGILNGGVDLDPTPNTWSFSAGKTVNGSPGNDALAGSAGPDILNGLAGNDTLNGLAGADTMAGGDGNDIYYVDNVGDVVSETNATAAIGGTDTVYAYLSSYTLGANVENLRIVTSGAANGTGNGLANVIYAGAGNNLLNGDAGIDTASYAYATAGVTISLAITSAQATGGSGSDTLLNFENLTGSNYNDTLTGNSAANILNGGTGADRLNGGGGADTMVGGDGNDIYYVDNTGDVVSETNANAATGGTDTVYSYLSTYLLGTNVENLRIVIAGEANGTGNGLANTLYAGAGNNVLDGGAGSDTVSYLYATAGVTASLASSSIQATGGSGNDTLLNFENLTGSNYDDTLTGNSAANSLNGGVGADRLIGGGGADTMVGGDGNDIYYVDNTGDVVSETNANAATGGTDIVYSYLGTYLLGADVENLRIVTSGASNGTGNGLNNVIYAGAGNNVLDGGAGVDTVSYNYATAGVTASLATTLSQATGGSGSDTLLNFENLNGSNYNDTLTGNGSNNVLFGGLGKDTLTGGLGADTFRFNSAAETDAGVLRDSIQDFSAAQGDKINLSSIDANSAVAYDQAFSFTQGAAFSGSFATQASLYYDQTAHVLYGNNDADATADFSVELVGVASLALGSIVV